MSELPTESPLGVGDLREPLPALARRRRPARSTTSCGCSARCCGRSSAPAGSTATTAEDVVQTTWLALVRSGESIAEPRAVAGWLCTSARREAWRVAKQSTRQQPVEDETIARRLPDEPAPEGQVVLDDDNARLWACLGRLPERCQQLLRIVAAEARPDYSVIATELDMPVGSIGPTRGRCLDKLRRELAQAGGR